MVLKCKNCDHELPKSAKFCLECGEKVEVEKVEIVKETTPSSPPLRDRRTKRRMPSTTEDGQDNNKVETAPLKDESQDNPKEDVKPKEMPTRTRSRKRKRPSSANKNTPQNHDEYAPTPQVEVEPVAEEIATETSPVIQPEKRERRRRTGTSVSSEVAESTDSDNAKEVVLTDKGVRIVSREEAEALRKQKEVKTESRRKTLEEIEREEEEELARKKKQREESYMKASMGQGGFNAESNKQNKALFDMQRHYGSQGKTSLESSLTPDEKIAEGRRQRRDRSAIIDDRESPQDKLDRRKDNAPEGYDAGIEGYDNYYEIRIVDDHDMPYNSSFNKQMVIIAILGVLTFIGVVIFLSNRYLV